MTDEYRRRGVATWLLGQAADWLRFAQVERLLDYAWLDGQAGRGQDSPGQTSPGEDGCGQDDAGYRAFLTAAGFGELTRTRRGWVRQPDDGG